MRPLLDGMAVYCPTLTVEKLKRGNFHLGPLPITGSTGNVRYQKSLWAGGGLRHGTLRYSMLSIFVRGWFTDCREASSGIPILKCVRLGTDTVVCPFLLLLPHPAGKLGS